MEHQYVQMPAGTKGWDLVEKMTGRRAVPAVFYKFDTLKEFYKAMDDLNLPERQLTEDELEEIDDWLKRRVYTVATGGLQWSYSF